MRMEISDLYEEEKNGNEANLIFNIQFPFISIFISLVSTMRWQGRAETICDAMEISFTHLGIGSFKLPGALRQVISNHFLRRVFPGGKSSYALS